MDDYLEIDLRKLIKNIFIKWYWVLIPALLIGGGAFIYSYTQPDLYQATTHLALTEPPFMANFEGRFQTNWRSRPSNEALNTMILSDEISNILYNLWDNENKNEFTLRKFKEEQLNIELGEQGMVITLTVLSKTPENATLLANTWADMAIEMINSMYYGIDQDLHTYFETQKNLTYADYQDAAQDLVDFDAEKNIKDILQNELNDLFAAQNDTLRKIRSLKTAIDDINNLIDQLSFEAETATLDPSYRLSYLLIQSRVYSGLAWESAPIQLMVDFASETETQTVASFRTMLQNWLTISEEELTRLGEENEEMTIEILALQAEIQSLNIERGAILTTYNLQKDIYEIVSKKYEEVRLTIPDTDAGNVKLISAASVPEPEDRLPHNTVRNTAIGAFAGGLLGLGAIIAVDWWNAPQKQEEPEIA